MDASSLRIVFMGTPEFSVASLAAMLEAGLNVVGVVTVADKPAGRGQKLAVSPVKRFALEKGLKVLQPEKLKSADFLQELDDLKPDLQVVVAFRMLPEVVWNRPPLGTFNLHGSLLPQYRGAAPINWCIINGENTTGVTTFFLQQEIDTGAIILREILPVGEHETAGELHDRMKDVGAQLVVKTVLAIANGNAHTSNQEQFLEIGTELRPAPKLNRENTRIDWSQPTKNIHDLIRGLSPYPAAHTSLHIDDSTPDIDCKIYKSVPFITGKCEKLPGSIETDLRSFVHVHTSDGYLEITDLQLAGKQRMPLKSLLNGFKFPIGARFH